MKANLQARVRERDLLDVRENSIIDSGGGGMVLCAFMLLPSGFSDIS